ncbi:hypothetical protein C1645_816796 [Glomus cerebriforme]|uniref:Uncharacterized protein n=1 Tax=Glomus cerebriforme TaxID=658196 RepID=A0A397TAL5_9GLOM|nr:hypothetical protein C1645_816796 [Glomus cerebriforme]
MNPTLNPVNQIRNVRNNENISNVQPFYQQYNNTNISMRPTTLSQPIQYYYQAPCICPQEPIHPQEPVVLTEYSFFYRPPNDIQIYGISCKEIPISFELVFELLSNDNNQNYVRSNNLHEFHFLKIEEKKCYKVTCEIISHSSIIQYLNKNIHGIDTKQNEFQQQQGFSIELKENLEYYLKQFLATN